MAEKIHTQLPSEGLGALVLRSNNAKPLAATDFSEADRKRFWSKVDIKGENECWEWMAGKFSDGYGAFGANRRLLKSNRVVAAIRFSVIETDLCACHHCDNRGCCNPDHIFIGTTQENTADRHAKGRDASGERNGSRTKFHLLPRGINSAAATLTPDVVMKIYLEAISKRASLYSIARKYGVSSGAVWHIANHTSWSHLTRGTPNIIQK